LDRDYLQKGIGEIAGAKFGLAGFFFYLALTIQNLYLDATNRSPAVAGW
jgi:hypothetical protein